MIESERHIIRTYRLPHCVAVEYLLFTFYTIVFAWK